MTIAATCALDFFTGSTNEIELTITDRDAAAVTDATVTIDTIVDEEGTELPGPSFPLTASHIAAGLYRATVVATADWGFAAFGKASRHRREWWAEARVTFSGGAPVLVGRVQLNVNWWDGKTIT